MERTGTCEIFQLSTPGCVVIFFIYIRLMGWVRMANDSRRLRHIRQDSSMARVRFDVSFDSLARRSPRAFLLVSVLAAAKVSMSVAFLSGLVSSPMPSSTACPRHPSS